MTDAYEMRRIVALWLRIRMEHVEESNGLSDHLVPRDKQRAVFQQIANDADHSDLLVRLFNGEEPMPFDQWRTRYHGG